MFSVTMNTSVVVIGIIGRPSLVPRPTEMLYADVWVGRAKDVMLAHGTDPVIVPVPEMAVIAKASVAAAPRASTPVTVMLPAVAVVVVVYEITRFLG